LIEKEIKESHLRLTYRRDMEILFLRWSQQVGSALLRASYQQALAFAEELNVRLWLFDLRGRGGATPEDEAWILKEFFPMAEQRLGHGNYVGYLLTPNHYAHVKEHVGLDILADFSESTKIRVFMSEAEAINWLSDFKPVNVPKN
jgi:hypothetical protein